MASRQLNREVAMLLARALDLPEFGPAFQR